MEFKHCAQIPLVYLYEEGETLLTVGECNENPLLQGNKQQKTIYNQCQSRQLTSRPGRSLLQTVTKITEQTNDKRTHKRAPINIFSLYTIIIKHCHYIIIILLPLHLLLPVFLCLLLLFVLLLVLLPLLLVSLLQRSLLVEHNSQFTMLLSRNTLHSSLTWHRMICSYSIAPNLYQNKQQFNAAKDIIANTAMQLKEVSKNKCLECFQQLYEYLQKYVADEESYFERNAVNIILFMLLQSVCYS